MKLPKVKAKVSTLGIDLAKSVFHVYAADLRGNKVFSKKLARNKLLSEIEKIAKEDDFLIAMESCGGANHIARMLIKKGYEVKLIAPKFVRPFVGINKNDARDAEAITVVARRSNMKFVGVKPVQQQDLQAIHRVREQLVKQKTAKSNETRGLLMEYGITIPQGISQLRKQIPMILEDAENGLTGDFRNLLLELYEDLTSCIEKVENYDKKLSKINDANEDCKRLSKIEGIGVITATALIASVGDPNAFKTVCEETRIGQTFGLFLFYGFPAIDSLNFDAQIIGDFLGGSGTG